MLRQMQPGTTLRATWRAVCSLRAQAVLRAGTGLACLSLSCGRSDSRHCGALAERVPAPRSGALPAAGGARTRDCRPERDRREAALQRSSRARHRSMGRERQGGGGSSPVAHGVLRRTHLAALRPRRARAYSPRRARARAARSTLLYVGVRHDSRRAAAVARGRRRQTGPIWKQHAVVVIRQEGRRRATPRALARGAEEAIALSAERSTALPSAPAAPSSRAAELH